MCNSGSCKTKLESEICKDIQSKIQNYYDRAEILYKSADENPESTIIDFFSYLYKMIPVVKRKVEYSHDLKTKMENGELSKDHIGVLKNYERAFEEGKDMNTFLSNKTNGPNKIDFLLYTWHLYHLHMSGKFVVDKTQMKNNRSNTLLLCIINIDCVYFVDVIQHPKKAEHYFCIRYLEIIKDNNWMEQIGFYEVPEIIPESLVSEDTSEKDIFSLYSKCAINRSFMLVGKVYLPVNSMTSTRKPQKVVEQMISIKRNIRKLNGIEATYKGFRFASNDDGFLMGIVEFKNSQKENMEFNIF